MPYPPYFQTNSLQLKDELLRLRKEVKSREEEILHWKSEVETKDELLEQQDQDQEYYFSTPLICSLTLLRSMTDSHVRELVEMSQMVAALKARNAELEASSLRASDGNDGVKYRQLEIELEEAKQMASKYRTERNQLIKVMQKQQRLQKQ